MMTFVFALGSYIELYSLNEYTRINRMSDIKSSSNPVDVNKKV